MHLDFNIYKLLLIFVLLFITLIIIVRIKVRPKKMIERVNMETFTVDNCIDIYDALKEYKVVNIHYTFAGIFIYLFCNLFIFLYLRYLCIGQQININNYIQRWSILYIVSFVLFTLTLSIGLYIIHILFHKEYRKLHIYLVGNEKYLRIVNKIHDRKYDSLIIYLLINRLGKFLYPIVITHQSIEEYHNFKKKINSEYKISKFKLKIQKFLRYHYEKNGIFKYFFDIFYLKIVGFINLSLPKWMRVFPEILLVLAILYDINHNVLYSIFYMSILYIILINIRKIKEFYIGTDPVCDEDIHNYLYEKGELLEDDMWYNYIEQYIRYNFKYWIMVDHPSRGPWHELRTKENTLDKYLSIIWVPFIYFIFYQDSYTIFVPILNLNIPCFIFLWILIGLQYVFYFILFYKNCFLFSASETILDNFGIVITQNFTIEEKAKFVLDYIKYYLPTGNILNSSIIILYSNESMELSKNINEIRSAINLAFNNYNIQYLKIDSNLIYIPLPEIVKLIRNTIIIGGVMKYLLTQYEIIEVTLKLIKNDPEVIYELIKKFVKILKII